jgi:hypothetical protein
MTLKTMQEYNAEMYDEVCVSVSGNRYRNRFDMITTYNDDGEVHNQHGPAIIWTNGDVFWYLKDVPYTFDEWLIELNKLEYNI